MTPEEEHAIRSQLKWKRDGSDWVVLLRGRRPLGRVTPDYQHPGMWRSPKSDGRMSDMANISWAKDAIMAEATRELAWDARQQAALTITPSKTQQNRGGRQTDFVQHSFWRGACYPTMPQPLKRLNTAAVSVARVAWRC